MNKLDSDRPTWDEFFMLQALLSATRTNCFLRAVGAVLVHDNRVIASGYNGAPPGSGTCLESGYCHYKHMAFIDSIKTGEKYSRVKEKYKIHCPAVHAEGNVVAQCAKYGISMDDTILYSTTYPCPKCANDNIAATGIKEVVYLKDYIGEDGLMGNERDLALNTLKNARVSTRKVHIPNERIQSLTARMLLVGGRSDYEYHPAQADESFKGIILK